MKSLLTALAFVLAVVTFTACQQSTATSTPTAGKGTFTTSGPDVELLKKVMTTFEKGDWEAHRACFSDSAAMVVNQWAPDTNVNYIPVDTAIGYSKKYRLMMESVSVNQPIYEVVTDSAGNKYGHVWAKLSVKTRNQPKPTQETMFTSYGIKDGKITYAWLIMGGAKPVN